MMNKLSNYLVNSSKSSYHPLISIIMPVYNRENVVMNAINSVLNQSYDNFELISALNIEFDANYNNKVLLLDKNVLIGNIKLLKQYFNPSNIIFILALISLASRSSFTFSDIHLTIPYKLPIVFLGANE